jgi:hypothetical protein
LAYNSDLEQAYAFYCSRYQNITFDEFLKLGYKEFSMKLSSIPESEPLFKIIQSRVIDIGQIKDKEEKKYWRELKRINAIPDIYKSSNELDIEMRNKLRNGVIK